MALQAAGADLRPLAWLRGMQQLNMMQVSARAQRSAPSPIKLLTFMTGTNSHYFQP